ncbi:MAG: DUF3089 domain-containing protein, partial [Nitrososphaerales archaeon]
MSIATVSSNPARASTYGADRPDPAGTVWLCRPGLADDPCTANMTTTVEQPAGRFTNVTYHPAPDPPIDCFYVYPNISGQRVANTNLDIEPQEVAIAELEASPFSRVCRVFAPMYRSATGSAKGQSATKSMRIAYDSVESAWEDYLSHYNDGRGVVLVGHSEGSDLLIELIGKRIDLDPSVRRLLVSAIIPGANLPMPQGVPWGPFLHTGVCRSASQTGCVVTYNAYSQKPTRNSLFGRTPATRELGIVFKGAYCTNPASLGGGSGPLVSLYRTRLPADVPGSIDDGVFGAHPPHAKAQAAWVQLDDEYSARCVTSNGADILLVSPHH